MFHIMLHLLAPLMVALTLYGRRWRYATLVMIATMLVDLDHLLANPIYDPERCSIGYHPLHTMPAILIYAGLLVVPLAWTGNPRRSGVRTRPLILHLIGLGLVIHMALDWLDCLA